jgi:hypothetical protein
MNSTYSSQTNVQQTFGRQLMSYISSKLPYAGFNILDFTEKENPKFKTFEETGIRRNEALSNNSVSQSNLFSGGYGEFKEVGFSDLMYANVQNDKGARLQDYRVMAAFAEVSNALDEICDEMINRDAQNNVMNLRIKNKQLDPIQLETLQLEFQKYVQFFDLENKGWIYFRDLLTEGELYFEHIIHKDYTNQGVLGVVRVPTELVDTVFNNVQNMIIKGFLYRKPIFDVANPKKKIEEKMIPMQENQIVYINSGIWNQNKTVRLPFIENARRAYRQLSLIEDSIVIYRLVRAPERLVFNVDVGNMAPPKAEAYLRKLITQYWSSKTFDVDQNDVAKKFNPQSMLDSFWFAKRAGSEGTSVTQLPGGQNLGELTDLMYFVKKLYESLKVPVNRLDPQSQIADGSTVLREELKFARFIIRMQQLFASGIKKGFMTHLMLKGIWKELELKEYFIDIEFNPPTNYYELRQSQRMELKVTNFNNLASNATVSPTYLQKKILQWTDLDIKVNREYLRKDKEFEWELAQIQQSGPYWKIAMGSAPAGEGGGDMGGGGGAGPGGAPPAFAGGPAALEAPPEAGAPPETGAVETPPEAGAPPPAGA